MKSNWHLKRFYNGTNLKWFSGKLPSDTICRYGPLGNMGEILYTPGGQAVITISPRVRMVGWNAVALTMMHEMVHLDVMRRFGTRQGHGPKFQERMLALAKAGAFKDHW